MARLTTDQRTHFLNDMPRISEYQQVVPPVATRNSLSWASKREALRYYSDYANAYANKLLDNRAPSLITQPPAISPINFNQSIHIQPNSSTSANPLRKSGEAEPSPIRLQRIVCEDQEMKVRERERYLKLAEKITNRQIFGGSTAPEEPHQRSQENSQERYKSPYTFMQGSRNERQPAFEETHPADQTYGSNKPPSHEARQQDATRSFKVAEVIKTPNRFGFVPQLPLEQTLQQPFSGESSPERIAQALKQNSPLRRKLANDALTRPVSADDHAINPVPSKITHTLITHELNELRSQVHRMQRDKNDLEVRLQEYEQQRYRQNY